MLKFSMEAEDLIFWDLGEGNISFWMDHWVGDTPLRDQVSSVDLESWGWLICGPPRAGILSDYINWVLLICSNLRIWAARRTWEIRLWWRGMVTAVLFPVLFGMVGITTSTSRGGGGWSGRASSDLRSLPSIGVYYIICFQLMTSSSLRV